MLPSSCNIYGVGQVDMTGALVYTSCTNTQQYNWYYVFYFVIELQPLLSFRSQICIDLFSKSELKFEFDCGLANTLHQRKGYRLHSIVVEFEAEVARTVRSEGTVRCQLQMTTTLLYWGRTDLVHYHKRQIRVLNSCPIVWERCWVRYQQVQTNANDGYDYDSNDNDSNDDDGSNFTDCWDSSGILFPTKLATQGTSFECLSSGHNNYYQ